LTALEWDAEAARRAVWLLALFPTAFFTFAPYTEALFLLCAAATLFYARQGRLATAGLWLGAAILTRSTGFILIPAVLLLVRPTRVRDWLLLLSPAASAAALYLSYLAAQNLPVTGLLSAQRAWHRALTFPWTGFVASIDWLRHPGSHNPGEVTENLLQLVVTLIFLLLTAVAWRHVGRATVVYCLGFWLLVLTAPQWLDHYFAPFGSMARFVLALFPLAGWFASRLSPRHYRLLVTAFGASMLGSVGVHLAGGWVG
jgi:hypothetical protein